MLNHQKPEENNYNIEWQGWKRSRALTAESYGGD